MFATRIPIGPRAAISAVLIGLCALACRDAAPLADDSWPGFEPRDDPGLFLEMSTLTLLIQSDRRDSTGHVELTLADGSQVVRELPPRIANLDQFPLGMLEPGEIELRLVLEEPRGPRSLARRVRLLPARHHGLALDLRTPTEEPASLRVDLGAAAASPPAVRLFELDQVLEQRRTVGADPEGRPLEARRDERGHWVLEARDLARGEHVLRLEPGGIERLVWLDQGPNRVELDPPGELASLEVELIDARTASAPAEAIVHWTRPVDAGREPTVVAPAVADYRDGLLRLDAAPGTLHLLISASGIGTRFETVELPPEGLRARLEL